jgi:hypothetical protein
VAGEEYRVEGELVIRAQAGIRSLQSLAGRLESLRSGLAGSQSLAGGLVRSLMGFGAAYVGINAVVGGMRALVSNAVEYQQGLEGTRIGLAAVMSAVEHIPFSEAQRESAALFEQIQTDALRSVATSRELFDIFQGIYGPLRGAGLATTEIRDVMLDTVSAATALNIDLPQASRDIQAMARGAAGMDVRLFSMLRATGAIAEDAQAFNALSQPERIAIMTRALGSFSEASEAYGQSFAGVTSTFRDIVENLTGALFGPAFGRLTTWLGSLNDRLLENRDSMRQTLQAAGAQLGEHLGRVFAALDRAMDYLASHWGEMMEAGRDMVRHLREVLPGLIRAGQTFLAFSAARAVLATGLGGIATAINGLSALAELGTLLLSAGGAGGGVGAFAAAMSGLAAPLAAVAAVFAAVAGVALVVYQRFDAFQKMFSFVLPVLEQIGADLAMIGVYGGDVLVPMLELLGTVLSAILIPALLQGISSVRIFVFALRGVLTQMSAMAEAVRVYLVDPFRDFILELGVELSRLLGIFGLATTAPTTGAVSETVRAISQGARQVEAPTGMGGTTPTERATTVNDFRGSRITVNQEFRQSDPDRVLMYMIEDINRQAESRITSNFVPALTRY